ncbi:hypothetical protein L6164_018771 [Bauhinia variegata]|uniref:Uncharacterized protein n=1 Tax=Bauhinia variegata TaxID=167791 RepID=A0ACB9NDH0_BAUVA|nr:hypothetical protein L6164_018771 [Bauhinia variegata]
MASNSSPTAATPFSLNAFPSFSIKLDRDNYFLWRTTALSALEAFDPDGHVPGDIPAPPQHVTWQASDKDQASTTQQQANPDYLEWGKKDRLFLLWIKSLTGDKVLRSIARANSSRDAWQS